MVSEQEIREILKALNFEEKIGGYEKSYSHFSQKLECRIDDNQILYSNIGIEVVRDSTSNFNAPENLVVLECVDRLLTLGYRPEHIVLEPHWKVGHGSSGGFGDILIKDSEGKNSYIIIECKVYGNKYDKELKALKTNGGQLFTYFKEEPSTQWLTLYASKIENNEIIRTENTVSVADDENIKLLAKKDKSILLFSNFGKAEELFNVWKEVYGLKLWQNLVLNDNSSAYNVGVAPLKKRDLKDFTPDDKIVNKFEEILHHNNVSDKENAFNRLVALFICKLVDEIRKGDDDIVEFQYKQGTDTYETLQDRLQRLHKEGMEDFMKEKIFYVSEEYPEWLFSNYTGQRRKYAIEDLKNTIKILKFYSNNDFSFKDVHNEELFLQNGKILVEVVQLFENYRIVYPSKHQFLGDLFEQLLNKGFKQNEGQFFTPMPITRFIWDCLPLRNKLSENRNYIPKIIDYACGAGHFLTEAVEAINSYRDNNENGWVRDSIYGIEKDYRLARVAKISLFMNGAGEGNIIFGEGLDNAPDKGIMNDTFDFLVANPPYSVSSFKSHLKLKHNSFEILSLISNEGKEIETLFVERIAQLVKPGGIAAVVLPVGLFTNNNKSANAARKIMVKSFKIRAIVQLPGNTFSETGQNTNIIFLEKYNEPPKVSDLITDTVSSILDENNLEDWEDNEVLKRYLQTIGITLSNYYDLLNAKNLFDKCNCEYEDMMIKAFFKLNVVSKKIKSISFKNLSEETQKQDLRKWFRTHIKEIEKEKLFCFALTYNQQTCIITGPNKTKAKNSFLGYKWSKRKGQEGIDIINYGGKLFNPIDRNDNSQLAGAIRLSFLEDEEWDGRQDVVEFIKYVPTYTLFDFSRSTFDNAISTTFRNEIIIKSKYKLHTLGDVCEIKIGGTPSRRNHQFFQGENLWVSIAEMNGQIITDTKEKITDEAIQSSNVKLIKAGSFLLSFKLSIGKTAIAGKDLYTNEAIAAILPLDTNKLRSKYLFYLFKGKIIDLENVDAKSFGKSVNSTFLKQAIKIPIPPISIQDKLIAECEIIDNEYRSIRMSIDEYKHRIQSLFSDLDITQWGGVKLSNNHHFTLGIGQRILNSELEKDGIIPVYSANVHVPFGKVNHSILNDFSTPSVIWGIDGDWMVNYIPANTPFNPTDHCGVLRIVSPEFNTHFVKFFVEIEGTKNGYSRSYRASIDRVSTLTIPKVPIEVQDNLIAQVEELQEKINRLEERLPLLENQQKQLINSIIS